MAIKFMNKLGTKEKFVRNVPGLGRLTHSQDSEVCTSLSSSGMCLTDLSMQAAHRRCQHADAICSRCDPRAELTQECSRAQGSAWLQRRLCDHDAEPMLVCQPACACRQT